MATLKKYDINGKELEEVKIEDKDLEKLVNPQLIKDYLIAMRNNARQWSANTKGRKEINRTGAKPHKQKGLGRARQGSFGAPQYKGGGIVFGPKPKFDQHTKINSKEKKAAIRTILIEKIKENKVFILKHVDKNIEKTKQVVSFFDALQLSKTRVLVLAKQNDAGNFRRCTQNIPKKASANVIGMNGYDLVLCQNIVIMESAIDDMKLILTKGSESNAK